MASQQDSDSNKDDLIIQAIIFDEIHIPPSQKVEVTAKRFLKDEAERSRMLVQKNKYIYSNRGRQTLMEDMEAIKRQTHQISQLLARIEDQERRVVILEGQVGLLTLTSKSYRCIRQRFLDIYKRDGNVKAYEGDALADASLFSHDKRSDIDLYRELYGLEYKQVLEIHDSATNDGAILTVLNAHATVLAQGKSIPDDVEVAFKGFLCQLVKNWLKSPRQEAMEPLGMAYCKFWKLFKKQYPTGTM